MPLNDYETAALVAIRDWQAQPPGPATRWFGRAAGPASRAVQRAVPESVLRGALQSAQRMAARGDGEAALLARAGVADLDSLRQKPLAVCDRLAGRIQRRGLLLGGVGGAAFGVAGKAGLVLDVPSILVLALRSIHRVGLCYGERCLQRSDDRLVLSIFAVASANSVEEKAQALLALRAAGMLDGTLHAAWRDGVERAAERELAKEAATYSLNNLARTVGLHLGWRKAASVVPVMGALVGGSVNAWYIHDVARVARYCFQERWLAARDPDLLRREAPGMPLVAANDG